MAYLSSYCIHTFRHSGELEKQEKQGGRHTLIERKAWKTGSQLWADAQRVGEEMPIIFSAADEHIGLIYWATIDNITVDYEKRQTTCSYLNLSPITPVRPRSALRLRVEDRPLSDDLIRPYAICQTPSFLSSAAG